MSMIRKIEMGWAPRQWLELLKKSWLTKKISFIFASGHACVQGNECTDRLAGMAAKKRRRALDQTGKNSKSNVMQLDKNTIVEVKEEW
uniref:Uncharacterized protein n=1 Tax=Arion vulgaris TaxID=1028688 RepID=A0A0B7BHH7_9EUPU